VVKEEQLHASDTLLRLETTLCDSLEGGALPVLLST
jgi:hypothetical protein